MCGGTRLAVALRWPAQGLSPRVRGNPSAWRGRLRQSRSIPACAGEPQLPGSAPRHAKVYPRVCGGTAVRPLGSGSSRGLSPRVRGNPMRNWSALVKSGSIPACAGEPAIAPSVRRWHRVYPRVCGGTVGALCQCAKPYGLSPRVRGNRADRIEIGEPLGSIPACAGEPLDKPMVYRRTAVYPRVCGGTAVASLTS